MQILESRNYILICYVYLFLVSVMLLISGYALVPQKTCWATCTLEKDWFCISITPDHVQ